LGSAQTGRKLFNGGQAFANGGVSCISCHQTENDGGTLGPSLADIASKMPAEGLEAACETTPFKMMKEAYAAHPITKQEAMDLTAYFESLKNAPRQGHNTPVDLIATAGAVGMLLLIAWGYRHRNTSVREKLKRR
jgi:cytochrome c553